jgi:predicted ester cyclase
MRKFALLCLATIGCSAWFLGSAGQRTAVSQPIAEPRQALYGQGPGGGPGSRAERGRTPSEESKIVVRKLFDDVWNNGRYELIDTIYARTCPVHSANKTARLEDALAEGKGWREAAPDLHMTLGEMTTQGNRVLVSWTATGTHTGHGNGLRPTGNHVVVHGRSEFRVVDGRIVEVWNHWNRGDLYRQLGVNPRLGLLFDKVMDLWSFVNGLAGAHPLASG